MTRPADPTEAFWRTQGIARALGLSFSRALETGRITETGYAELVAACCCCPHAETCLDWLGRHGAHARRAPEFCRNGRVLEALSRAH
jgi:hypothetical protein